MKLSCWCRETVYMHGNILWSVDWTIVLKTRTFSFQNNLPTIEYFHAYKFKLFFIRVNTLSLGIENRAYDNNLEMQNLYSIWKVVPSVKSCWFGKQNYFFYGHLILTRFRGGRPASGSSKSTETFSCVDNFVKAKKKVDIWISGEMANQLIGVSLVHTIQAKIFGWKEA